MTEAVEPRLPTGLSPSSISLYHQCPRRFKKEKIERRRSPGTIDSVKGTFVHRSLELLMDRPPRERTLQNWSKVDAVAAWKEIIQDPDFVQLNLDDAQKMEFRRSVKESAKTYFGMEDPTSIDVVATEQEMSAIIRGVPLRGIVDRLERDPETGQLVVADYKNGKVPQAKYAGDKERQMIIYGAMVEAVEGERPRYGRLIFTAYGEEIQVWSTDAKIDAVLKEASDTWDAIHADFATDDWKPITGPLCGWCPFVAECPEGRATVLSRIEYGQRVSDATYALLSENIEEMERKRRRDDREF